jgi:hypothetical protein
MPVWVSFHPDHKTYAAANSSAKSIDEWADFFAASSLIVAVFDAHFGVAVILARQILSAKKSAHSSMSFIGSSCLR